MVEGGAFGSPRFSIWPPRFSHCSRHQNWPKRHRGQVCATNRQNGLFLTFLVGILGVPAVLNFPPTVLPHFFGQSPRFSHGFWSIPTVLPRFFGQSPRFSHGSGFAPRPNHWFLGPKSPRFSHGSLCSPHGSPTVLCAAPTVLPRFSVQPPPFSHGSFDPPTVLPRFSHGSCSAPTVLPRFWRTLGHQAVFPESDEPPGFPTTQLRHVVSQLRAELCTLQHVVRQLAELQSVACSKTRDNIELEENSAHNQNNNDDDNNNDHNTNIQVSSLGSLDLDDDNPESSLSGSEQDLDESSLASFDPNGDEASSLNNLGHQTMTVASSLGSLDQQDDKESSSSFDQEGMILGTTRDPSLETTRTSFG